MNSQDPLSQLQDIHLPAEIGLWPLAWGWWILIVILLSSIALTVFFTKRHKSRNAYRAIAVEELEQVFKKTISENNSSNKNDSEIRNQENHSPENHSSENRAKYLQALSIILRRTALSGFGNHFNASLKNEDWLRWLDEQCSQTKQEFSQGIGRVLLVGPYQKQPTFDPNALQHLAILWIKEHRNQWQQKTSNKSDTSKTTNNRSEAKQDV